MEVRIEVNSICTNYYYRYAVETHIGSVKSLTSHYVGKTPYVLSGGVDESIR